MLKPSLNTVQDVVRAHADDTEDKRRLPDSVVEVLRESGFNRLAIPATLGGREAPVREMVKSVEAVAMVDGSAGWCAAIGAGSNVFAGYLPEAGARHASPTSSCGPGRRSRGAAEPRRPGDPHHLRSSVRRRHMRDRGGQSGLAGHLLCRRAGALGAGPDRRLRPPRVTGLS